MDDAQRNLLREHLPYEHDMLDQAFEFLTSGTHAEERVNWFKRNAAINEFWVHARNLIEFYDKPKVHNASASAFTTEPLCPEFRLRKGGPAITNAGMAFSDLINEQVCHLKYERVSVTDEKLGGYDLQRVKESIDRAMKKFQGMLTPEARAVWVDRIPTLTLGPSVVEVSSAFSTVETTTGSFSGNVVILGGHTGPAGPARSARTFLPASVSHRPNS